MTPQLMRAACSNEMSLSIRTTAASGMQLKEANVETPA